MTDSRLLPRPQLPSLLLPSLLLPSLLLPLLLLPVSTSYGQSLGVVGANLGIESLPLYVASDRLRVEGVSQNLHISYHPFDNVSVGTSYNRLAASTNGADDAHYDYHENSLNAGYQWQDAWFDINLSRSQGSVDATLADGLQVDSHADGESAVFNMGYDWYFERWSPGISAGIGISRLDFQEDQRERSARQIQRLQEEHSGTDGYLGVTLGYMTNVAGQTLVPMLGIDYQHRLQGEILGNNQTSGFANNGDNSTSNRSTVQQTRARIGLWWPQRHWTLSTKVSGTLNCPCEQMWQMGAAYSF